VLNCLFLLIAHSAPSFLSFHSIRVFSILVPTSKSRHHFSFSCTHSLWNFFCHRPLILPDVSGFFDSFPSFLLVCVFVPFTQLYIHLSFFCCSSFHFFTGIPVSLIVFLSFLLLRVFYSFASGIPLVSYHPFCLYRSLSRFHSQPIPLTLFPHYVTWRIAVHF
jgi:hypothetical protein